MQTMRITSIFKTCMAVFNIFRSDLFLLGCDYTVTALLHQAKETLPQLLQLYHCALFTTFFLSSDSEILENVVYIIIIISPV